MTKYQINAGLFNVCIAIAIKSVRHELVSYPDPDSPQLRMDYITATWKEVFPRSGDVIHPQLWESGSGYETSMERARDAWYVHSTLVILY